MYVHLEPDIPCLQRYSRSQAVLVHINGAGHAVDDQQHTYEIIVLLAWVKAKNEC